MLTRTQTLWLAVLCLLVAAALRLAWLNTFPPGLHYDLAANVTLAGDIAWRGYRPVFISSYTGKEALFFYFVAGLMRLLGETPFTLRLTAAYSALLTVAVAYPLGRVLFKDRRVALLGMLFLATSFWHILLSRYGFRAITQPLLQGLTIYFLWVGLADPGRRKPFALAGLFLGLAAYTYLAVRLFPVALALPLLLWWREWRKLLPAGLLTLGVGLLVLLPLLAYFMSHSDAFWVRIGQVGQDGLSLPESLWRTLLMFNIEGDPYIRFNLPGRPLFNPLLSLFFIAGVGVMAWQLLRPADPARQLTAGLMFAILFIMVLPTALATNEIVPSNLRTVGLLPFVMFFPAVGLVWLIDYARPPLPGRGWMGGLTGLLFILGGWGYLLYFEQWGNRPDTFYENDGDLTVLAQQLNQHPEWAENPLYVSALHLQHPTLAALTPAYNDLQWLLESQALVFPAAGPATYLFPHNSPPQPWMAPFLSQMSSQPGPLGPDGQPTFVRYTLPQPLSWQPSQPAQTNFGYALLLHGYDVGSGPSGTDLPLTLYWEVLGQPTEPLMPFVHVEDQWQHRWAQVEPLAYPSDQWQVGEKIVQRVQVPLPAGTPPGRYRLRVGLFNAQTQSQMARFDASGRYAGNALVLEDVYVLPATQLPPALPTPPRPLTAEVLPGLNLLGYELNFSQITTGEPLPLALWWHYDGQQPLPELFTRLDLIPASQVGQILTQTQPAHGSYPFASWQGAQLVIDRQNPAVPLNLPAGWYQLHVRLLNGGGDTLYTTVLGEVDVTAGERLFTPPAIETQTTALFGSEIQLLGYTLTSNHKLSLVWQAAEKPTTSYTVFVHLLNPDGSCCVWQQDSLPQQGSYPTTRWLPNEVVVDEYQIELPAALPAGEYPLEIGLYLAETGQRLTVTVPGQPPTDFLYLRPVVKK